DGNPGYGIGYADAADPGNPAGLAAGQIEIKYTLYGDADLDGSVTGSDFTILVGNLGKSVNSWDQGDFNYDGAVGGVDFTMLVGNLGKATNGAAIALPAADLAAIDAFAAANGLMADVPEPGSGMVLVIAAAGAMGRRRRSWRFNCIFECRRI
ncbi:MAG TPA: dockerin type I domain-containing protein, partial [Tepidisphaeraceae bacterium]